MAVRDRHFKISSLVALCSGLRIFTRTRDHRAWSADQCRSDPQLRWRLTDIAADSFTWRGESSRDSGVTWQFDEQMLATRVTSNEPAGGHRSSAWDSGAVGVIDDAGCR